MGVDTERQHCSGLKWEEVKMMAQASVILAGEPAAVVEIRRGMKIASLEGREAGKVAGVVIWQNSRKAACLILSHLPEETGYQSLPVSWIARVDGDTIFLSISFDSILATPEWHPL